MPSASMTVDVIDHPVGGDGYGAWSGLMQRLVALAPGKTIRIKPRLDSAQGWALRSAARRRGYGLHLRHTAKESYVWMGKRS